MLGQNIDWCNIIITTDSSVVKQEQTLNQINKEASGTHGIISSVNVNLIDFMEEYA